MRFSIESQTLVSLEGLIATELTGLHLWGDFDFSLSDYESLREKITAALSLPGSSIEKVALSFPISFTTLLVFLTRYKFDSNFWGLLSEELSAPISLPLESKIGDIARSTFIKYGFDFSDVKHERRVYLEPILYEAGRPPESCLDDLFYVLNYDSHSLFDPQLIIEDLTEMRSYQIRKPMLNFFRRFKDRALDFVIEVREAMLCVDQSMPSDSIYVSNYTDWKEREHTREAIQSRKKQEFQTKPYLAFDNGRRGLCMILPRVLLKDEWVEEVYWSAKH